MPPAAITDRQAEIKALMDANPGISVAEMAARMEVTENTVYAHIRRMREGGVLSKKRAGRAQRRVSPASTSTPAGNFEQRLNTQLQAELERIGRERQALEDQGTRLLAAREALG